MDGNKQPHKSWANPPRQGRRLCRGLACGRWSESQGWKGVREPRQEMQVGLWLAGSEKTDQGAMGRGKSIR